MLGGIAQVTNLEVAIGFAGVVAALIAPAALAARAARRREDTDSPTRVPAINKR
jgi:hypothetical protein